MSAALEEPLPLEFVRLRFYSCAGQSLIVLKQARCYARPPIMNVVFLSPHFPPNWFRFVVGLRAAGANVLGIGDTPTEALRPELRAALGDYYRVDDLANRDQVHERAGLADRPSRSD